MNNQPQLLGRWRFVGTQKNGMDLLDIKLINKRNRYKRLLEINNKLKSESNLKLQQE
tara:strand:+ start:258 stop:428 length:171 start_codon:yes stop_codon:yes gene_type:complete